MSDETVVYEVRKVFDPLTFGVVDELVEVSAADAKPNDRSAPKPKKKPAPKAKPARKRKRVAAKK